MTFLEKIYPQVAAIRQISTDEFSKDFLGMGASYYRSMKARQLDASTSVLVTLMERLGELAIVMRSGKPQTLLLRVADRYEALGEEVGQEIARRSLQQAQHSKWVRETLYRIVNNINSVGIRIIQKFSGHRQLQSVQHYLDANEEMVKNAVELLA